MNLGDGVSRGSTLCKIRRDAKFLMKSYYLSEMISTYMVDYLPFRRWCLNSKRIPSKGKIWNINASNGHTFKQELKQVPNIGQYRLNSLGKPQFDIEHAGGTGLSTLNKDHGISDSFQPRSLKMSLCLNRLSSWCEPKLSKYLVHRG